MKKFIHWLITMLIVITSSYLVLYLISSIFSPQAGHVPFLNDHRVINQKIESYRPLFQKYARAYGLANNTDLLMAMAMQETKGNAVDLMQASESEGLPKDSIKTPDASIRAGTEYFKKSLDHAHGDVRLALQSYNFGLGFTDYVQGHGGKYSQTLAERFSKIKAKELGWASYGDPNYVSHVLRYYNNEKSKRELAKRGTPE